VKKLWTTKLLCGKRSKNCPRAKFGRCIPISVLVFQSLHRPEYHVAMPSLLQRVQKYLQRHKLIHAGDRVGVAVSGGADSTALLRLLLELRAELGIVLSMVHLNHGLRGQESDDDEKFVSVLAHRDNLEFHCERVDARAYAKEKHLSLEAAGRALRYSYFRRLIEQGFMDRIATAHTLDDQAETILFRIMRGAGTRGLAGIYPKLSMRSPSASVRRAEISIVRPVLEISRNELRTYLSEIGQSWREDSSNQDPHHARNRVRHELLPWLQKNLNPSVCETLAGTSEIARAEEAYWEQKIGELQPQIFSKQSSAVDLNALCRLPLAMQRRLIRAVGSALNIHLEFFHVEEILKLAHDLSAHGPLQLPASNLQWNVRKHAGKLHFQPQESANPTTPNFQYSLPVPGTITVAELRSEFHATLIPADARKAYNPQHSENLLDAQLLASELQVRNWREGDRFWPAHKKIPRKVKQLLQERHVTGLERKSWPVIISRDEIVWMRGFAPPAHLALKHGSRAVKIQEIPFKKGT
jgi:tRNA(Ile)-lysidine synthase